MSKYHQNGVTTSQVDFLCLVCQSTIKSKEEADSHILKPIHKKNLQTVDYCEQFKVDHIRKIKNGYFCEFCNLLFPTTAKVNLHLQDKKHINNKGNLSLIKVGNTVTAFGNLRISEKAWNGFIETVCLLCDVEFENEGIHRSAVTHLINLIHKQVEFTSENYIYRKIDEDTVQCLTCNKDLALGSLNNHFGEKIHKDLYEKCIENAKDTNNNIESQAVENNEQKVIKNNVPETVDAKKNGAIPKTTVASNKNKDKKNKTALDIEERICKELNATNYIIRDLRGDLHCILCSMDIQSPREHLACMHHQTLAKMHMERVQNNYGLPLQTEDKTIKPKQNETPQNNDISKIVDSITTFQKQDININFETFIASCKKCSEVIKFDFNAIQNHIEGHKKTPKVEKEPINFASKSDPKKGALFSSPVQKRVENIPKSRASSVSSCDSEIDEIAKKNNLSYESKNNRMFCELCKVSVPMSKKNILEHINGWNHRNNKSIEPIAKPIVKCPKKTNINDFITEITHIETMMCNDVIINREFCISAESFIMIKRISSIANKCEPCGMTFNGISVLQHICETCHTSKLHDCYVMSVDNEFVREIGDKYHCGYCNTLLESWTNMLDHFKTNSHINTRNSSNARLESYKISNENQEVMNIFEMLRLLRNRRFM